LSRMPSLTRIRCQLSATFPYADPPLFFSNLYHLSLSTEFLDPISQLLSRIRLPAITHFTVFVECCPSKHSFSSFLASVQTSAVSNTIKELSFDERLGAQDGEDVSGVLGFEDLQPCMTFSNLRRIHLDHVDLLDSELLTLTSAWPHLEHLSINEDRGWRTPGGITPNGLLQLLQTCPSLKGICLAIDTRGYTEFRESLGLSFPPPFSINVLNSSIEEESVPAIAAFLTCIAPCPNFCFWAHEFGWFTERPDHKKRWYDAYNQANVALGQRS
ncbi:hypothetical protein OG21DRAFT_1516298, partial [Imleria badia]